MIIQQWIQTATAGHWQGPISCCLEAPLHCSFCWTPSVGAKTKMSNPCKLSPSAFSLLVDHKRTQTLWMNKDVIVLQYFAEEHGYKPRSYCLLWFPCFYCFCFKEQPGNLPALQCSVVKVKVPLHLIIEEAAVWRDWLPEHTNNWVHSPPQPAQQQTQRHSTGNMAIWREGEMCMEKDGKILNWENEGVRM